jgi:hypothetical protein
VAAGGVHLTASDELLVPPDPGALIASMRAFGYSLPTAIADLVDNSITAGARSIEIDFDWNGSDSSIAVTDDGHGMDESELLNAMRLGSISPSEKRASDDLGRFGLGLKSAAWSQALSLTVISCREGRPATRRWDLDHVVATKAWSLLTTGTPRAARLAAGIEGFGTVVLMERPDRLVGNADADDDEARERFFAMVRATVEHVGMVFHRFLTGRNAISISVNGSAIEPWDPFMDDHPATQRLPEESLPFGNGVVTVSPFVLPHVSKLTSGQHGSGAGVSGWNAHQGFYVYRARRLLVAGSWLGLPMRQEEHYKLARVRVDLPNDMDEAWQIDVRKATARIPGPLLAQLRRIAKRARQTASEAYRFRGKTVARQDGQNSLAFVWQRTRGRHGAHAFKVNREHPVLAALATDTATGTAIERALQLTEENLPVEAIVMDAREHPDAAPDRPFESNQTAVAEMLRATHAAMLAEGIDLPTALTALAAVEPFDAYPELIATFREELDR